MAKEECKQKPEKNRLNTNHLLELDHGEAKEFFIKQESYCSFELPPYFCFEKVLQRVHRILNGKNLKDYCHKPGASSYDDVNHTLLTNKDGKYAWRPFTLIHPALYYVLVDLLTSQNNWTFLKKRFGEFQSNSCIQCLSRIFTKSPIEGEKILRSIFNRVDRPAKRHV